MGLKTNIAGGVISIAGLFNMLGGSSGSAPEAQASTPNTACAVRIDSRDWAKVQETYLVAATKINQAIETKGLPYAPLDESISRQTAANQVKEAHDVYESMIKSGEIASEEKIRKGLSESKLITEQAETENQLREEHGLPCGPFPGNLGKKSL